MIMALFLPGYAQANAIEFYGFGASGTAQGLSSAAAPGALAAYGNPGFLTASKKGDLTLGLQGSQSSLFIEGSKRPAAPARASQHLLVGFNLPLGEVFSRRLHLGVVYQSPLEQLVTTRTQHAATPHWAFFDGYTERVVSALSFGWDLGAGMTLGLGAQNNVGLEGQVTLAVDPGTERFTERQLDFKYYGVWSPILGLRWQVGKTHLGLSYRSKTVQSYATPALVNVEGLDAQFHLGLGGQSHFVPSTTEVAARYQHGLRRWFSLGVVHKRWSEHPDPRLDTSLTVTGSDAEQLGLDSALSWPDPAEAWGISPGYSDTLAFALAGGWEVRPFHGTLSYGFEPSPVPEQVGFYNQADGDNHQLGWGVGYDLDAALGARGWTIVLAGRHRIYPERNHRKERVGDVTGDWSAGGILHILVLEVQRGL